MASVAQDSLADFGDFVALKVAEGARFSPEIALALWREKLREVDAIREGFAALERGESRPAEEFLAELDAEFGLDAE